MSQEQLDIYANILAALELEVMSEEKKKSYEPYDLGYVRGLKRSINMIDKIMEDNDK
jgi:hypothetical protein